MIAILTVKNDLHALEVAAALARRGGVAVRIVETDQVAYNHSVSISLHNSSSPRLCLTDREGLAFNLSDCSVIWVRRPQSIQSAVAETELAHGDYLNNECRSSMGAVLNWRGFSGRWISDPTATFRASDKVYQLQIARECGFQIPKTVVCQSKDEVLDLFIRCNKRIIVKPLVGVSTKFLVTCQIEDPALIADEAFSACPAIYQERIEGTQHIRLFAFGNQMIAGKIDSEDLDWRPNLNVPISDWNVPKDLADRIKIVLSRLGLRMGIFDLKISPNGTCYWLEVNPQGQFLFLQPFVSIDIAEAFAGFLLSESQLAVAEMASRTADIDQHRDGCPLSA